MLCQYFLSAILALIVLGTTTQSSPLEKSQNGKYLIKFLDTNSTFLLTLGEFQEARSQHRNFIDITNRQTPVEPTKFLHIPTTLQFQSTVRIAISRLSLARVKEFMVPFTSFHSRHYLTSTGIEASNWLFDYIKNIAIEESGVNQNVTVDQWTHPWTQSSVIARIHGSNSSLASQRIILGAHLDSTNDHNKTHIAPGADDNASGCSTILEAFRTILQSGIIPKRTIEFHWYAAEEVGLRGSTEIAEKYSSDAVDVVGMVNFDMTGYVQNDTRISIMTYYTDPELSQFMRLVIDEYSGVGWIDRGYAGASDFISWTDAGFRSASPNEMYPSKMIHAPTDTLDTVDYGRILGLSKVALGLAIELAEPDT